MSDTHVIALESLNKAIRQLVRGFGSAPDEVEAVASNLIDANLMGHDSHGIGMLPRYAAAYLQGGLKPNTHVRVELDGGALLRLDGGAGFGQVIGREAMALGIERARAQGSCIVALGNSHHLGRIGAWAEQAADAGLVSMHFVNVISRAIVAPFGGSDARFGTNPFCAGVPFQDREPVILDFATSVIAQGKTRVAMNKGEQVPPDHLIDDQGRPTLEPRFTVVPPFGALLTIGAHKGYGLARDVRAARRRAGRGHDPARPRVDQAPRAQRHVQRARRPGAPRRPRGLRGRGAGLHRLGQGLASRARASTTCWWPANPSARCAPSAAPKGVPVDATTWQEILAAADQLGLDPAQINAAAGLH